MNRTHESLDQRLQALPRAIEPPQDLWPAIQGAIRPARRQRWPLALAASVAVTITGSLYAWHMLRAGRVGPTVSVPTPITSVSFASPQQPAYLRAHAQLERLFHERLQLLRPDTRAKVEANLKIIHDADDNIRRALQNDPASPLLLELLENTQQQEINLYMSVVENTEPAVSRS
jgi:hypothetical protein